MPTEVLRPWLQVRGAKTPKRWRDEEEEALRERPQLLCKGDEEGVKPEPDVETLRDVNTTIDLEDDEMANPSQAVSGINPLPPLPGEENEVSREEGINLHPDPADLAIDLDYEPEEKAATSRGNSLLDEVTYILTNSLYDGRGPFRMTRSKPRWPCQEVHASATDSKSVVKIRISTNLIYNYFI